jgi:hypothetical protein
MEMDDGVLTYEQIKQLAKQTGQRVTDLIPLAPQNDPFYTGTPACGKRFSIPRKCIFGACITRLSARTRPW